MDWNILLKDTIRSLSKLQENNKTIDLSESSFLTPFFIAPISAYLNNINDKSCILPIKQDVFSYMEYLKFPNGINVDEFKKRGVKKTYLPLFAFYKDEIENDEIFNKLMDCLTLFANIKYNKDLIYNPLSELIDNIKEHSNSTKCIITAQIYEEKYLAISLVDNGKTIPQNYLDANFEIKDEIDAFEYILKGKSSTKDDTRGFGIQTSLSTITEPLGGVIMIVSGSGALYKQGSERPILYNLSKYNLRYSGTIINILFEIPREKINVSKYDFLSKKVIY